MKWIISTCLLPEVEKRPVTDKIWSNGLDGLKVGEIKSPHANVHHTDEKLKD
jgi:hypothetical protein